MISGTLTLFSWSLKSDSRAFWPHVIRAGFSVFILFSISAAVVNAFGSTGPGLRLFQGICFLNVLLISVSGISYFVSAVTEEKESGTLALLRLAGVTPLAIVLGKSVSRLFSTLMLLLTQLPFTFLSITLGGVTWQQILAAYAALAAWMALVSNIALFSSVRCRTPGRAAGLAGAVLVLFFTINPVVTACIPLLPAGWLPGSLLRAMQMLADWQASASVIDRLQAILEVTNPRPALIDTQVLWNLGIAFGLFVVSTLAFDRWSAAPESVSMAESETVRRFTVGRCWKAPILWKDFLFFTGGCSFFLVKLLAYGGLVAAFWYLQQLAAPVHLWLRGDLAWTAFITLLAALYIELLLYSSGSLFTEVRQSTISSLTMLPLATSRILLEKAFACLAAMLPVLTWTLIVFLMAPSDIMRRCSATMVVSYLLILLLSSHLTVLLSLYTRWAALPLAILLTAACFLCCPMLTLLTFSITELVVSGRNPGLAVWLGFLVNMACLWLFLLLPMEIEIINRWNRLSEQ